MGELARALAACGLLVRGGFHPGPGDGAPEGARSLILIGNAGPAMWAAFAPRAGRGPDPLNAWIRDIVHPLADRIAARALYPADGPPYWPFQRWAMRAEPVQPSPLGILIHPRFGLWHAYRAGLSFDRPVDLPPPELLPSPCATCATRPCLTACPVGAFEGSCYDVAACAAHLESGHGGECLERACLARRACPIGREHTYAPAQAAFHMAAFLRARTSGS